MLFWFNPHRTCSRDKCLTSANIRAKRALKYHTSIPVHEPSLDLPSIHQSNVSNPNSSFFVFMMSELQVEKERELQRISDLSIALLFLSDHLVKSVSIVPHILINTN